MKNSMSIPYFENTCTLEKFTNLSVSQIKFRLNVWWFHWFSFLENYVNKSLAFMLPLYSILFTEQQNICASSTIKPFPFRQHNLHPLMTFQPRLTIASLTTRSHPDRQLHLPHPSPYCSIFTQIGDLQKKLILEMSSLVMLCAINPISWRWKKAPTTAICF